MKKLVMKLDLQDEKDKKKAMQVVSGVSGVNFVAIGMKEKKLTVTGDVDPVEVATKLRKLCHKELLTVSEDKKDDKKDGDKKDVDKKDDVNKNHWKELELEAYRYHQYLYNYATPQSYYYHSVVEENPPNSCVIC